MKKKTVENDPAFLGGRECEEGVSGPNGGGKESELR